MNKRRWISACMAFIIIAGAFLLLPKEALACSCAEPGTAQERKDRSHAVFEGTAATVKSSSLSLFNSSSTTKTVSFKVNEVWKGQVAATIEVLTAASGASCGFEFTEGQRYLVYAYDAGNSLEVSLCSGTMLYSESNEQMVMLGTGSLPPQPVEINQQSSLPWLLYWTIIVICAAFVMILFALRKRNKIKSRT